MDEIETDVVVVGSGPTGSTAAGDLVRAGRRVVVLERRPEPNPSSRAFATMARTLELLDARGLADGLLADSGRAPRVTLFKGATLDLTRLDSPYRFAMITPQTHVDRALEGYAIAHGAEVRRGWEVTALAQDGDGVSVTARPKDDDDPRHAAQFRAAYVVAADGAHSTVRDLLGADFPGRTVLSSIGLADVELDHGPAGSSLTVGATRDAFGFLAPYGDGRHYRAMVWDRRRQLPDTAPLDREEVVDVLSRTIGGDLGVAGVGWHSRFHCDERQVREYRHGRVFLAGDAAHVHSPMGGQGMNTGIQDAANLAWKLDAVLGGAHDAVLDTYQSERHPIGRRVLRQSGLMMRAVTLHARPARWLRDLVAPRVLGIHAVSDTVAGSFAGTGLRYGHAHGESPLVGTRATPLPLADTTLTALQRDAGFALVRRRDDLPVTGCPVAQARRTDGGPAVLVRPDGYVAWAGSLTDGPGWAAALARWAGPVRPATTSRVSPPTTATVGPTPLA